MQRAASSQPERVRQRGSLLNVLHAADLFLVHAAHDDLQRVIRQAVFVGPSLHPMALASTRRAPRRS
jgi:hypothetical protein